MEHLFSYATLARFIFCQQWGFFSGDQLNQRRKEKEKQQANQMIYELGAEALWWF